MALAVYTQQLFVTVDDFTAATSGYSEEDLKTITELFTGFLLETGKVRVLTRNSSQLQSIQKEHDFERDSGLVAQTEIRRMGEALGADATIKGELRKLGSENIIIISLTDNVSNEMLAPARKTYKSLDDFLDLLPSLANGIVTTLMNIGK
jgi:TolB-like protein